MKGPASTLEPSHSSSQPTGNCPFHERGTAQYTCWYGRNPYEIVSSQDEEDTFDNYALKIPFVTPVIFTVYKICSVAVKVIRLLPSLPTRIKNSFRGRYIANDPNQYIPSITSTLTESEKLLPHVEFPVLGNTIHIVAGPQLQGLFFGQGQTGGEGRVVDGGETKRLLTELIGPHSLMTCTQKEHNTLKPLMKKYFEKPDFLRDKIPHFVERGELFIREHLSNPGKVNITNLLNDAILNLISAHIGLPENNRRLKDALHVLETEVTHLAFKTRDHSEVIKDIKVAHDNLHEVIQEARGQLTVDSPDTLLKGLHFYEQTKEDQLEEITVDQLNDNITLTLFGGKNESFRVIENTLYHLGKNPDLMDQIYEEFKSKGKNCKVYVNEGRTTLDSCLWETLRLYPPIHGTGREATQSFKVVETVSKEVVMDVNKGNWILLPIVIPQRDKARFGEDANTWNPLRFKDINDKEMVRPFGVGPYSQCLAKAFAPPMMRSFLLGMIVELKKQGLTFETLNEELKIVTTDNLHSKYDIEVLVKEQEYA